MTDIPATTASGTFNRARAFRSIAISIAINAVCPYLIYRYLEPRYPAGSLTPLLASTVFPLLGLVFGAIRQRTLDMIALISLVEIVISIVVTMASSDIRFALIARALQGTLTGVFFLFTVLIRRPLFYYVARQFVAGSSPAAVAPFDEAQARDGGRTFRNLTMLWGVGTILISFVNLWLAQNATPANYLLIAPILGIGCNVAMVAWTIGYATRRFRPTPVDLRG
ncbi:MAG: hypothetical protein JO167_00585 [Alphaproteobacteria bacterium]|nr:hypothetical protein [Alphaproteobacteria bacterium]MBV9539736.1 hypothetical protein [Alphaproteobacteria bacterium]